jgi:hypothetical protein
VSNLNNKKKIEHINVNTNFFNKKGEYKCQQLRGLSIVSKIFFEASGITAQHVLIERGKIQLML